MVQRKDSLCFVEFMRGKYNVEDGDYVMFLLAHMTQDERDTLSRAHDFTELWSRMWTDRHSNRMFQKEYEMSKLKFGELKSGCVMTFKERGKCWVTLQTLLQGTRSELPEREWGFPKGRRNSNEDNLQCALREFQEETSIPGSSIGLLHDSPCVQEEFVGSNGVPYRHVYFVALGTERHLGEHGFSSREIECVAWFDYAAVRDKISPQNSERRAVIHYVHTLLHQDCPPGGGGNHPMVSFAHKKPDATNSTGEFYGVTCRDQRTRTTVPPLRVLTPCLTTSSCPTRKVYWSRC
jgi:8-oxo-dGTP pyrophosphatase MutT (NUDIX family)